jgi:hypothetical protein
MFVSLDSAAMLNRKFSADSFDINVVFILKMYFSSDTDRQSSNKYLMHNCTIISTKCYR